MASFLHATCLKSSYSLRTQLLLSFGSSAFLSLVLVVIVSCLYVFSARNTVHDQAETLMRTQVTDNLLLSSKLAAKTITAYMDDLEGTVQLIAEVVLDRIVGYPNEGWEDDLHVPFLDMDTQTRKYPLNVTPPPLDWDIALNIKDGNAEEHVQERVAYLKMFPETTTASASYFMQGACDPAEEDPSSSRYFPNCTESNNNLETGGAIQPTRTNKWLHKKSGDIGAILKPLYEAQYDALVLGIYFHNAGAGSVLYYPGITRPGASEPYESIGCDWMREINPRTKKPFATEEEISRCHPSGTMVPQREYNGMERAWCRHFALNPEGVGWFGPFRANDHGIPIMVVGRALFDRKNGNFIGCAGIDVALQEFSRLLDGLRLTEDSEITVVRYGDGMVVADTLNSTLSDVSVHFTDIAIIGDETIDPFQNSVNFEEEWNPEDVEVFDTLVLPCWCGIMTAYPLPVPPSEYDSMYRPKFMAVHAIKEDTFAVIHSIDAQIDSGMVEHMIVNIVTAIAGMTVIVCILWYMSRVLTQPLLWMESVAWRVVNYADESSDDDLQLADADDEISATARCTPDTEIKQLVAEFRTMIQGGFSGEGASKVANPSMHEIRNDLTWHSDFQQLYTPEGRNSRQTSGGRASDSVTDEDSGGLPFQARRKLPRLSDEMARLPEESAEEAMALIVPPPVKRNRSPVVCPPDARHADGWTQDLEERPIRVCRSSLFWWIVILIVIPLLVTIAVICTVSTKHDLDEIPSWIDDAYKHSQSLEAAALRSTADSKALLLAHLIHEPLRDLHLMTRLAGWMFFGGISRSDGFTETDSASEECKTFPERTCPFFETERAPCACQWEDLWQHECRNHTDVTDPRYLQEQFYAGQKRDADPETGRRNVSRSFPSQDNSPGTTWWWDEISELPGAEKGEKAAGFNTTYDRVRVASATSVVEFPVYNYATSLRRLKIDLGTYVAFEADGLLHGFSGCSYVFASMARWQSTDENRAARIAPELCPLGKYGFDPRCRCWYKKGKRNYQEKGEPVHVTAPYPFAFEGGVASSATSPLTNLLSGEYLGQVVLDFYPSSLYRTLERLEGLRSFLVTKEKVMGCDTVVGPDKSKGWEAAPIGDLIFLERDSVNRFLFEEEILADMKNGSHDLRSFDKMTEDGVVQKMAIAFAPVYERALLPLNPSNFSAGANVSRKLLYSVGIYRNEDEMHAPFLSIADHMEQDLSRLGKIYISVSVAVSILFTVVACVIAVYIATPMITLLRVVEDINAGKIEDDIRPLQGGSREIHQVYSAFAKLCKVVRASNTAFFSGNLKWAYHFVSDALELFRKVDDQKAIGIACNNLGNTLFAMIRDSSEDSCCNNYVDGCAVAAALSHYDESIEIGQEEFDGDSPEISKADFAQQLADRLFNRGLFLLFVDGSDCAPADSRERGYKDITRAQELDNDVNDFWLDRRLLLANSAECFCRLIRRINGLADFYDDIGLREVWDVAGLIDKADQLLSAAWNRSEAPLFEEITRIGRLQQLEGAVIRLELSKGRVLAAARLAMRMFSEDEYILESSFVCAAEALLRLIREEESISLTKKAISCTRDDLRRMLKSSKNFSLNIGKCLVFSLELSERWEGEPILEKVNANCLKLYDRNCVQDDYMGLVAYRTTDILTVPIGAKDDNEGRQGTFLDIATMSTSERANPTFPLAVQMVVDSQASLENDSYIILILDGYAWDPVACPPIKGQIEKLNRERNTMIHLFIIGLDMEDEEAREQCKTLSMVTKASLYTDATLETIDATFEAISAVIAGHPVTNGFLRGLTMERF